MKTFPSTFATEAAKKTGIEPVFVLKVPFVTGGTKYLSDRGVTISGWDGGVTTVSWVARFSAVDESLGSGDLALSEVSALDVEVINDPNVAQNIEYLLDNNDVEALDCELYLWFNGLDATTDPPQLLWTGNITDWRMLDSRMYRVELNDQLERLNQHIGSKINTTDYPDAKEREVGRVAPIVYGTVKDAPAREVVSGAEDYIDADMTASQATLSLIDASGFPTSGTVGVDAELMTYTGKSGNQLTGLTRGTGGTTAATHDRGTPAWEERSDFTFLLADHPAKAVDAVYARGPNAKFDITSVCTIYTGQTGDEHPTFGGKAVAVAPSKLTEAQAVDLGIDEGDHTHAKSNIQTSFTLEDFSIVAGGWRFSPSLSINNDFTDYGCAYNNNSNTRFYKRAGIGKAGPLGKIRIGASHGYSPYNGGATATLYINGTSIGSKTLPSSSSKITTYSSWWNVSSYSWSDLNASNTYIKIYVASSQPNDFSLFELWLDVEYDPSSTNNAATGVTLFGNSVAGAALADTVNADIKGYEDDGSGTFTGTPYALIERPDHVLKHFLYTYVSWPTADFYTDAASEFATKSFAFAGVIDEHQRLSYHLHRFALQCRCRFRFAAGKAGLLWRPDSVTSDKTISDSQVMMSTQGDRAGMLVRSVRRTSLSQVINKVSVHYDRDWTKSGPEAYKGLSEASDSASITKYGEKERPELFFFDLVTAASMADDVRDHYIAYYKNRKKLVEQTVFLDNADVEFADGITLAGMSSLLCEVVKANLNIGGRGAIHTIDMTLREA